MTKTRDKRGQTGGGATQAQTPDGRHPAYGVIRTTRVYGGKTLFGSDLRTDQYVRLEIVPARTARENERDMISGDAASLITVDLSEAQYASMLTSMNIYTGTPCTIARRDGQMVPGIPKPDVGAAKDRMTDDVDGKLRDVSKKLGAAIDGLRETLNAGKLTKGAISDVLERMSDLSREFHDRVPYMVETFGESIDRMVDTAKVEINAYASVREQSLQHQARLAGAPARAVQVLPNESEPEIPEGS